MNKKIVILILVLTNSIALVAQKNTHRKYIDSDWQFRRSGTNVGDWMDAKVPGNVHSDLLDHNLIEDPFYRANEKKLQWVGEKDWDYKTSFMVDEATMNRASNTLVFEGLDTYAEVFLNGKLIVTADNMHRTWRADVKDHLKVGNNDLRINFTSVFKENMPKYLEAPYKLSAWDNNDQSSIWLSLYSRKAGFHFGWDWGPRLITTGIWRPVYLESWDRVKLTDVQVLQPKVTKKMANLKAVFEIESTEDAKAMLLVKNNSKTLQKKQVDLKKGKNYIPVDYVVKNPDLWWTNGLGKPNLYNFDFEVKTGELTRRKTIPTGIRSIKVITEKDDMGKSFTVELNGHPIFMKGANYIPLHSFQREVTQEKYQQYIQIAVESNMNMLRVWGGGIYEDDYFYKLCDENGILVWQDIMFACGMFPVDPDYVETVKNEVVDNVKRLRNHASIALWNGNNENEISWYGWGWKDRYSEAEQQSYEQNLKKLFYEVIPEAIASVDTTRYYHPTSPNTGYNDIPLSQGDVHYWDTKGNATLESYNKNVGRFMSEYGFQSYPEMNSIEKFTQKKDRYKNSEIMFAHNRARHDQTRDPNFGNNVMENKMRDYYGVPNNFEDYVYTSQIVHAKATKIAIEAHRRHMPFCMGTLYWQLNDCWPAISWATTDFYGNWKAAQYMAKEVYKPIISSTIIEEDKLRVYIVSDALKESRASLELKIRDLKGKELYSQQKKITISANTSDIYFEIESEKLIKGMDKRAIVLDVKIVDNGKMLDSEYFYFVPEKELKLDQPTIAIASKKEGGLITLKLETDVLARNIVLNYPGVDGHFSDNYFDLMPGKVKEVTFEQKGGSNNEVDLPTVNSLIDILN